MEKEKNKKSKELKKHTTSSKPKRKPKYNGKHPGGRPPIYNQVEIMNEICKKISAGPSLITILRDNPQYPDYSTIMQWLATEPEFVDKYARAREAQAEFMADEIVAIADSEPDPNKARVRVDARKWVAAHLKPKKYGDRIIQEYSGTPIGSVTVNIIAGREGQSAEPAIDVTPPHKSLR